MSSAIYRAVITSVDKFVPPKLQPLWNHPAGNFLLLHSRAAVTEAMNYKAQDSVFWAPGFKWALVIAGISDMQRPAEKLSATQSTALAATGIIWSRYSMVIIPKNYSLFSVNIFVALTGLYQLYRIYQYNQSLKKTSK